ncbi:MAG TPA: hypothetical protein VNZ86_06860 [Bacteroidia bacterium]|jgi:hypothetical protein|nr:hypothetical protein [Bacteroidia bacterium]
MKKNFKICVLSLLTVLGISSCTLQNSLVKRHYNTGYYVARAEKPSDPDSREQARENIRSKAPVAPMAKKEVSHIDTGSSQVIVSHEFARSLKPVAAEPSRNFPVTANAKDKSNHSGFMPFAPVHVSQQLKDIKHLKSEGEREGLSLFWLVILILLILWLLGLIGGGWGLGILINVLLLFALILLILWLLRIV